MSERGRKRQSSRLDSNCNKQSRISEDIQPVNISNRSTSEFCQVKDKEENFLTNRNSVGWIETPDQHFNPSNDNLPLLSQEEVTWKPTKGGKNKVVTLLAKVEIKEKLDYVRVVTNMGENTNLVTGVHKCVGDEESRIGTNNVFVSVLIEHESRARTIRVGEILGYAKPIGNPQSSIFNTFFTVTFSCGVARLKLDENNSLQMDDEETISVNVFVESLPTANRKNYPIQFESSNTKVEVIRDRYTIQKGNSVKVRIRNISGKKIVLDNGDTLGIVKSLNTPEFIEKIQNVNKDAVDWTQSTYSPSLPTSLSPDHIYSFVFLEIETLRPSNRLTKQITQVGCCSSLSKERNFFRVIEPEDLNHYLTNFQFGGNLLQFLRLQKNDSGQFEFRKQFEIVDEGIEIPQCTTENEALEELATFLSSFSSDCVLVSIRKQTIQLVLERMKHYGIDCDFVKGFCIWNSMYQFDDWYMANVSQETPSCLHSEAVASMHKEAIDKISQTYLSSSMTPTIIQQSSLPIQCLLSANSDETDSNKEFESLPEFLELHNSFRPNIPTTITMTRLDILELSSDEEESQAVKASEQIIRDKSQALDTSEPMVNSETIYISDTETDETINLPLPTSIVPHETDTFYCRICEREFASLGGLQSHVWITSKKHSKELNKVLNKYNEYCVQASPPSDVEDDSGGDWTLYQRLLWSEFKNRLSAMFCCNVIKNGEPLGEKNRSRIENLARFASNLQLTRAELVVNYVTNQVEKMMKRKRQKADRNISRVLFFIGSLSQKSYIFKELFETRIVEIFINTLRVSSKDVKHLVDLRNEWGIKDTFKTETLSDIDHRISIFFM